MSLNLRYLGAAAATPGHRQRPKPSRGKPPAWRGDDQ